MARKTLQALTVCETLDDIFDGVLDAIDQGYTVIPHIEANEEDGVVMAMSGVKIDGEDVMRFESGIPLSALIEAEGERAQAVREVMFHNGALKDALSVTDSVARAAA